MSLALTASTLAIGPGASTFFLGTGGTEPYVYSLAPGGCGGSINSSSGQYNAPSAATGTDTVIVTDFASATAQAVILVGSALELFLDILKEEMDLADDQIWLWNQKFKVPKDSRLYVVVGILSCKPFGSLLRPNSSGSGINADQTLNMMATLSIDIFSRSLEAVQRKEEIILSLASVYAEQQQELNGFSIARLPISFVNLSQEEGAAILYRFNISVNIQYLFRKTTAVDYFDDFSAATVVTEP